MKASKQSVEVRNHHIFCPNCSNEEISLNMLSLQILSEEGISEFQLVPTSSDEVNALRSFLLVAPRVKDQVTYFDLIPGTIITVTADGSHTDLVQFEIETDLELQKLAGLMQVPKRFKAEVTTQQLETLSTSLGSVALSC